MQRDVVVLGAGVVGLATALKIQEKGRSVAIVDRAGAGEGTSYGNAGIIERASIFPYAFPRNLSEIFKYALNNTAEARYSLADLPRIAPYLARYWWHSSPARHEAAMRAALPLIERCLSEHEPLIAAAGADHLIRRTGWLKLFRTPERLQTALVDAAKVAPFGLTVEQLDAKGVRALEPHLSADVMAALHYKDPASVSDPLALSRAYLHLFEQRGGALLAGDARTLRQSGDGWTVTTETGSLAAREVVTALGPWSDTVYGPLGYRLPMGVKRGYHMHYRAKGNAVLNRPVLDTERGYLLAPMARGVRLTTGAEFARRDSPPTPIQLERTEPYAYELFPIEARVDEQPWVGNRPCTPDMLPIIGRAPRHKGLWFAFGHAHHGLTLAAITGRLVAEMMTGEDPVVDTRPYRPERFAGG